MGYTELIAVLERLPADRRAEVFDFAQFLASRCPSDQAPSAALAELLTDPAEVSMSFKPLSRDEMHDRACLR